MSNDQLEVTRVRRPATMTLIGVNVAVAVVASVLIVIKDRFDPAAVFVDGVSSLHVWGEMSGQGVNSGQVWRLVTAMFLHYGLIHLLANMLLLWLAGRVLEPLLGTARFVVLYLLSGLASSAAIYFFDPDVLTAGASGAIFGLLAAYLITSVKHRLSLWLPLLLLVLGIGGTILVPGMSIPAHAAGLLVGAAVTLAYPRRERV